jgi:hypothetical protein
MNEDFWLIFGGRMYVSGNKGVLRKICVDATFDLDTKLHNNSLLLCIFETNEDFWLIFGGRMYQGIKVCPAKHVDVTFDLETEISFLSVSPKRIQIFY